jgi:hypothetical protein
MNFGKRKMARNRLRKHYKTPKLTREGKREQIGNTILSKKRKKAKKEKEKNSKYKVKWKAEIKYVIHNKYELDKFH